MLTAGMPSPESRACTLCGDGGRTTPLFGGCARCLLWCAARVQEHEADRPLSGDAALADIVRGLRAMENETTAQHVAFLESRAAAAAAVPRGHCVGCGRDSERRSASIWGAKLPTGPVCGDCIRLAARLAPRPPE